MLKRLCIFLFTPVIASFLVFGFVRSSLHNPIVLSINVDSPVLIERDSNGIPHIYAESLKDAYYGIGYSMCQDRMWLLDMNRRFSTGRLSEILGKSALDIDKYIRNMKLHHFGKEDIKGLPEKTKMICNSFIQGINDAAYSNWLPIEYYLTNSKWDNFTISDSQSYLYLSALTFSNIWGSDVLKVQLRKSLGKLADYLIPADKDLINPLAFAVDNFELPEELKGPKEMLKSSDFEGLEGFYSQIFDEGAGSNAWAISGKHTKSGKPIFSNDPHLVSTIPSIIYLSHFVVGNYSEYGGHVTGFPFHSIGRNNKFAWGATSLKVDDTDVYAEKVINSTHYQFGDEALEFTTFEETFKIKGEENLIIKFRETIHGPVIENSIAGVKKMTPGFNGLSSDVLSISWASSGVKDKSMCFTHLIPEFNSIEEFRKELYSLITATRCNHFVVSNSGDILYQAVGKVPIKTYKGDSVLPGWIPETKWKGFVPPEEMPYSLNPEKGFIVSANNYPVNDDYKYFESLGTYFVQARAERITELIQDLINKGHKFTADDQVNLFKDELDVHARRSVPGLLKRVSHKSPYYSKVKDMEKWDFVMSIDSKFAAIYAKWSVQLATNLLKDKVSDDLVQYYIRNQVMQNSLHLLFGDLNQKISPLCDNPKTVQVETCDDLITKSFEEAVEFVGSKTWGELHSVDLKHIPFSDVPLLKWIYGRQQPTGGWMNTVHATFTNWNGTFATVMGQGFKIVCDMGDNSTNYWTVETGNSGNVLSKHYDDMLMNSHYGELPKFQINNKI